MNTQLKHFAVHIKHNIVNQLYSNKQRKIKHRDGTGRSFVLGLTHTSAQSFLTLLSFTSLLGSFLQWVTTQQILGVDDGQGGLVCCSPWDHKESDMTEQLN